MVVRMAGKAKTRLYTGTSGYSFKQWRGPFYPQDLATDEWLRYYASNLPSVEINNSFYRMPKTKVVEHWRDSVDADFRFVIKASRRITHQQRLRNCEDTTDYLINKTDLLGPNLGAVLFQLPPNMPLDIDRLCAFQDTLPANYPAAFEFRHPSWQDAKVNACLKERGHTRVFSHTDGPLPTRLAKSDRLYLRLRSETYTDKDLQTLATRIEKVGASEAFVFFKHEEEAAGVKLAQQLLSTQNKSVAKPTPKRAARKGNAAANSKKTTTKRAG